MNGTLLNIGYVPLVDSAPLILAHALRFDREEGLRFNLLRQPSWSALRDLLALGHLDLAQMLSPLAVGMTLGLGGMPARIDTLMMLSVNGNVIGVRQDIAEAMRQVGWKGGFQTPVDTATALKQTGKTVLRVGVPLHFSMHFELFDYWATATGLSEQITIEYLVVPPPQMSEAIAQGQIDAFCVGEPWGSVVVESGQGELILPGVAIWNFAPEKVLAARHDWVSEKPEVTASAMRAVVKASRWLDKRSNQALAAEILARSEYLDLSDYVVERALSGQIISRPLQLAQVVPNFLCFHRGAASFPWRSQAAWIADRLARRNGLDLQAAVSVARASFRTDLYRENLKSAGVDMPGASAKLEGAMVHRTAVASVFGNMILEPDAFFDGLFFDPDA